MTATKKILDRKRREDSASKPDNFKKSTNEHEQEKIDNDPFRQLITEAKEVFGKYTSRYAIEQRNSDKSP